ncbi:MAG: CYTH domain-containing protein [Candidatus Moranbacteria bacterium]|nr:CYTH domain-containing protein [Candidatus Moranbacteria bacterium]
MFEVGKKFILSEKDIARLVEGSEFLGEKTFTDVYYDTDEFALTKNDIWLRKRGEEFELKLPMHLGDKNFSQQYQEIEGEEKIREIFAIAKINDFESDIEAFDYKPFCDCATTRKKFKKEGFVIDLDFVVYDDKSVYNIGEIELIVEKKNQMAEALEKIEKFAQKNGLKSLPVRGKVIEYLLRSKPGHYRALVEAGVVVE